MPYRICKSFEVENGHMLAKHPDKCRFPHGHSRKVELVIEADDLDANDMVCDFKALRQTVGDYLERFDHALCMNTADPQYAALKQANGERVIGFTGVDPTTEVLARTIFDHLQAELAKAAASSAAAGPGGDARYPVRAGLRVVRVRLWETSSSWAEYGG